ncbi:putative L-type lectin-domain containing receptor kinase II.2 [Morella rubra]|uniref:Putative L-type lectin-domain containing receptor kinase II.2 n=1 Tax=Morella rubra TaxID=262757 RepID=A0A6A1UKI4_9ROSI|nr:putative L-type lectin-domain containing receptor kinase II.2 [Morella rubra]
MSSLLGLSCSRWLWEGRSYRGQPENVILVDWVFECRRKGAILDASDPRLEGLLCTHANPAARPSMRQVGKQVLDGDANLPAVPYDTACFGLNYKYTMHPMFLSVTSALYIWHNVLAPSILALIRSLYGVVE